jgi:hypothetical protein
LAKVHAQLCGKTGSLFWKFGDEVYSAFGVSKKFDFKKSSDFAAIGHTDASQSRDASHASRNSDRDVIIEKIEFF